MGNTRVSKLPPGEILKTLYIEPLNLTITGLAEHLQTDRSGLSLIVNGKRSISAEMAIKLSYAFDTTPEYWLNLQITYDLNIARKNKIPKIKRLVSKM